MNRRQETTLYCIVVASIIASCVTRQIIFRPDSGCCERALSGAIVWQSGEAAGGFDGLVWAKTETGVQLRSANDIAEGDKWSPLVAPADTKRRDSGRVFVSRIGGIK